MGETRNLVSDLSEDAFFDEQIDGRIILSLILWRGGLRINSSRLCQVVLAMLKLQAKGVDISSMSSNTLIKITDIKLILTNETT